jgi:hypothetical protein
MNSTDKIVRLCRMLAESPQDSDVFNELSIEYKRLTDLSQKIYVKLAIGYKCFSLLYSIPTEEGLLDTIFYDININSVLKIDLINNQDDCLKFVLLRVYQLVHLDELTCMITIHCNGKIRNFRVLSQVIYYVRDDKKALPPVV